jgi:hypothetical protein
MSMKLLGIFSVCSVVTDLLWIRFSTFGRYYRKNGSIMGRCISYLLTSRKPVIQLSEKFFYNILLEFVIPKMLVSFIKMCSMNPIAKSA